MWMKQGHNERAPLIIELHVALSIINREATVGETANSEQVKLCQKPHLHRDDLLQN